MVGSRESEPSGSAFMNSLESHRLLTCLAGLLLSAALLWLASEVFACARARPQRLARRLKFGATLLGASGLWWPGRFLEPAESTGVEYRTLCGRAISARRCGVP